MQGPGHGPYNYVNLTADIMKFTDGQGGGGRVPEPGTLVLLGSGLVAIARRMKKNA